MKIGNLLKAGALAMGLMCTPKMAKADPTIFFNVGKLNLYLPFTSVSGDFIYDFKGERGLAGAETPIIGVKDVSLILGAVTSETGKGIPFLGVHLNLTNPVGNWIPLAEVHPGLVFGRDFSSHDYLVGIKASAQVW